MSNLLYHPTPPPPLLVNTSSYNNQKLINTSTSVRSHLQSPPPPALTTFNPSYTLPPSPPRAPFLKRSASLTINNNIKKPRLVSTNSSPIPLPRNSTMTTETKKDDKGGNNKTQVVFIYKLYQMLEDPTISHLIKWSPTNDSFYIIHGEEFSKLLPQFFKHTNIASFIRQLNMYGFHKVNETFQNDADPSISQWEFKHSNNQFKKGEKDKLQYIKRRSSKTMNAQKEVVNLKPMNEQKEQKLKPINQPSDLITKSESPLGGMPVAPPISIPLPIVTPPNIQPPQHHIIQQQSQHPSHPPPPPPQPIPQHQLFEFRPSPDSNIDLHDQLFHLKNDMSHLHHRYELLSQDLKSQVMDTLSLIDLVDQLIDKSNAKNLSPDLNQLKNNIYRRLNNHCDESTDTSNKHPSSRSSPLSSNYHKHQFRTNSLPTPMKEQLNSCFPQRYSFAEYSNNKTLPSVFEIDQSIKQSKLNLLPPLNTNDIKK